MFLLYALLVLKEKFTKEQTIVLATILAGAIAFSADTTVPSEKLGVILTIATACAYAFATLILKKERNNKSTKILISLRALIVLLTLAVFVYISPNHSFTWAEPSALIWIIAGSSCAAVFSHYLSYLALKEVPLSVFTVVVTISPIFSFLAGFILLGERLTVIQLTAASAILMAAIYYSLTKKKTITPK